MKNTNAENTTAVQHLSDTLITLRNGVAMASVRPNEVSLLLNSMGSGYHEFTPDETRELAALLTQAAHLAENL